MHDVDGDLPAPSSGLLLVGVSASGVRPSFGHGGILASDAVALDVGLALQQSALVAALAERGWCAVDGLLEEEAAAEVRSELA